jgi:hypothetical protein
MKKLIFVVVLAFAACAHAQTNVQIRSTIPAVTSATLTGSTCTGVPGSGTGCIVLPLQGWSAFSVTITGAWTGNIDFAISGDGGQTYYPKLLMPNGGDTAVNFLAAGEVGIWEGVAVATHLRVWFSTSTSGTPTVYLRATGGGGLGGGTSGGGGGGGGGDGLTNTQLRASPVPVSGPLTDAQLRATPVPISGGLTDAQLRASAVSMSAASLPLPTGAATSANQTTSNTNTAAAASGIGATSDAAATVGAVGSLNAKMRLLTSQMDTLASAMTSLVNAMNGGNGFNISAIGGNPPLDEVPADFDTTGATVNLPLQGWALPGAAGPVIGGTATNPLATNGNIPHGAADGGNPTKNGNRAFALGANPTAAAANTRMDAPATRQGIPFWLQGTPNVITTEFTFTDADNAQTNTALISVSPGTKIVVLRAFVACDADNTDDLNVRLGFATATLPTASSTGAVGIILSHPGVPQGSGAAEGFGISGIGGDGEDLRLDLADPVGGSCRIVTKHFTIEG